MIWKALPNNYLAQVWQATQTHRRESSLHCDQTLQRVCPEPQRKKNCPATADASSSFTDHLVEESYCHFNSRATLRFHTHFKVLTRYQSISNLSHSDVFPLIHSSPISYSLSDCLLLLRKSICLLLTLPFNNTNACTSICLLVCHLLTFSCLSEQAFFSTEG